VVPQAFREMKHTFRDLKYIGIRRELKHANKLIKHILDIIFDVKMKRISVQGHLKNFSSFDK